MFSPDCAGTVFFALKPYTDGIADGSKSASNYSYVSGKTISYYAGNKIAQMNESTKTYAYIAFGT